MPFYIPTSHENVQTHAHRHTVAESTGCFSHHAPCARECCHIWLRRPVGLLLGRKHNCLRLCNIMKCSQSSAPPPARCLLPSKPDDRRLPASTKSCSAAAAFHCCSASCALCYGAGCTSARMVPPLPRPSTLAGVPGALAPLAASSPPPAALPSSAGLSGEAPALAVPCAGLGRGTASMSTGRRASSRPHSTILAAVAGCSSCLIPCHFQDTQ